MGMGGGTGPMVDSKKAWMKYPVYLFGDIESVRGARERQKSGEDMTGFIARNVRIEDLDQQAIYHFRVEYEDSASCTIAYCRTIDQVFESLSDVFPSFLGNLVRGDGPGLVSVAHVEIAGVGE